jgi:DNA primase
MYYYEKLDDVSVIQRLPRTPTDLLFSDSDIAAGDIEETLINHVIRYYKSTLKNSERARHFLASRGVLNESLIERFNLGFSDRSLGFQFTSLPSWQSAATRGALQRVGIIKPSGHEFFRGALVFPFHDENGRVTGAYGRRITQKLKAYSVYHVQWLSEDTVFFNTVALTKYKHTLLCKSPVDALSLMQFGIENVVAIMGMKSFCFKHCAVLQTFNIETVGVAFDSNFQGKRCSQAVAEQLSAAGIQCYGIDLPAEKDVNQFVLEDAKPRDNFMKLLCSAFPLTTSH